MTEFGAIFGEKRIVDWRDETKSKFGGISGMAERSDESPERIENWMIKISTIFVIPENSVFFISSKLYSIGIPKIAPTFVR